MPESSLKTPEPEAPQATPSTPAVPERGYLVQVGAIGNQSNAKTMLEKLKSQFGVPGRLQPYNNIYRVQLGPFADRQQAVDLQGRIQAELNQTSMVVAP